MAKGKIFKKPRGKSKYCWNALSMGTTRGVTCQLCGTEWPELPEDGNESHHLFKLLGLQGVEECCGRAIDMIYREFDEQFAERFVHDFVVNPADPHFTIFLMTLGEALPRAARKAEELAAKTKELHRSLLAATEHR